MIRGLHHTGITTGDLGRFVQFYRDLMGYEFVVEAGWADSPETDLVVGLPGSAAKGGLLKMGNSYIEVWEYREPKGKALNPLPRSCDVGLRHICFDVDDMEAEYNRLKAAGVEFFSEPQTMGTSHKSVYGRDFEGNIFELQEVFGDSNPIALHHLPKITSDGQQRDI
jgi:glyoxylase I family protein